MRPPSSRPLALAIAALTLAVGLAPVPTRGADVDLKGRWKLVILDQLAENELMLIEVKGHGGQYEAESKDATIPGPPKITRLSSADGVVSLAFQAGSNEAVFQGKPSGERKVLGQLKAADWVFPARLEKSDQDKVTPPAGGPSDVFLKFRAAGEEQLPKTRVRLLRAILAQKPGDPSLALIYNSVVRDALAAEMSEAEVRKVVSEWVNGARPYGDEYVTEVRTRALAALAGKAEYARLALDLARETDADLGPDAPLATRARVASALAEAATLSGNERLAADARTRSDRLETELDEEYQKKVPPFKPEPKAGPDHASDRVVLLELFTGAECPPCVAADVAFDALNVSYRPTQLVTLQYHLHIPGPDPLTNPDSQTRSDYYPDFRGTPTLFLDGQPAPRAGGRMADSEDGYRRYLKAIDDELTKPSRANIDLKVDREGDTIKIVALADAKEKGSKLRLRLALIEEKVRYAGGNGIRFHHHVVRAMPGGVGGTALDGGKGKAEATVNLAELREELGKYLQTYARDETSFPRALPHISLSHLSVVAFVQDDDDRSVLNSVIKPAAGAK